MPDREKVIVGIEHCDKLGCSMCPYKPGGYSPMDCRIQLMRDALALLKEQEHNDRMFHALEDDWKRLKGLLKEREAVKPEIEHSGSRVTWWNVCGNCKTAINPNDKFCHECGRPVLWEGR